VKLAINPDWRITTDQYQYILHRCTNPNSDRWEPVGYFITISSLVNELIDRGLRSSEAETLADALKIVKGLHRDVINALTPQYKVISNQTYAELIAAAETKAGEVVPV